MDTDTSPLAQREWVNDQKIGWADDSATAVNTEGPQLLNVKHSTLATVALPEHGGSENPVCYPEQPTIHNPEDFVRTIRTVHNIRDRVQKGRRRLITEHVAMQQLRGEMEVLEDGVHSALERLARTDLQLSKQLAELKTMRKGIKSREQTYNLVEDQLYYDEFELKAKEDELYQNLWPDRREEPSSADASLPQEEIFITNHDPLLKDANPLYDYERAIGMADVLHEDILELIRDRQEILEDQRESGEELDQHSLDFLGTYEDRLKNMVKELDTLEEKILRLQKDAIQDGLLHPFDVYSRTRPWAAYFEQAGIQPADNRSEVNSEMEVPAELPNSEMQMGSHPTFQLPPALSPETYIRQWLNDPTATVQNVHRSSSISERSIPERIDRNWVYVKALTETELSKLSRPQPMPHPASQQLRNDGPMIGDDPRYAVPEQFQQDLVTSFHSPDMTHTAFPNSGGEVAEPLTL